MGSGRHLKTMNTALDLQDSCPLKGYSQASAIARKDLVHLLHLALSWGCLLSIDLQRILEMRTSAGKTAIVLITTEMQSEVAQIKAK